MPVQQWTYCWKQCFLFGLCKVVIKKRIGVTSSVEGWKFSWALQGKLRRDGNPMVLRVECLFLKKRVSCKGVAVKRRLCVCRSYSETVNIYCQDMTSEDWEDFECASDKVLVTEGWLLIDWSLLMCAKICILHIHNLIIHLVLLAYFIYFETRSFRKS
jgi:hypothetical protein